MRPRGARHATGGRDALDASLILVLPALAGVQVDQRVLKDLVVERMPKLNHHLERNNIDLSLVTFNFFLTISVDSVPIETALRILDCFLLEGDKVRERERLTRSLQTHARLLYALLNLPLPDLRSCFASAWRC